MDDPNPYAAPATLETTVPTQLFGQRDGLLAVRDGAELPHICVVSHQATDEREWRKNVRLTWTPQWVRFAPALIMFTISMAYLATIRMDAQNPLVKFMRPSLSPVLFSFIPFIQFLFWKRAKVTYSLKPETRARFIRNRILGIVFLALAFGLFLAEIGEGGRWFTSAAALVLFGVGLMITNKSAQLPVAKYRDGWFLLKGASPEFVATLPPV